MNFSLHYKVTSKESHGNNLVLSNVWSHYYTDLNSFNFYIIHFKIPTSSCIIPHYDMAQRKIYPHSFPALNISHRLHASSCATCCGVWHHHLSPPPPGSSSLLTASPFSICFPHCKKKKKKSSRSICFQFLSSTDSS